VAGVELHDMQAMLTGVKVIYHNGGVTVSWRNIEGNGKSLNEAKRDFRSKL
jgi:hypothetical protein